MTTATGNIIQFVAPKLDNERIHEYHLSEMNRAELKDIVFEELKQVVSNVLPHDHTDEDIQILGEIFNEILNENEGAEAPTSK